MYFVVIMAFALVLSDRLPVEGASILRSGGSFELWAVLGIVLAQIPLLALISGIGAVRTQYRLDGTDAGHEDAADEMSFFQQIELFVLGAFLLFTMVSTPWPQIVRHDWGLAQYPLASELILLAPTALAMVAAWTMQYPAELRLRLESLETTDADAAHAAPGQTGAPIPAESRETEAVAALRAARRTPDPEHTGLGAFLLDKLRHQVLILAVPMCIIVVAKHYLMQYGEMSRPWPVPLPNDQTTRSLIIHSALGTVSFVVLAFAPVMLRYIWATEPLPAGPLRDRFERVCNRIGLKYREILLWHTHGMAVNAAVMGFIAPLRYIMVSDALLETMEDEEIEAVFAHEAGHVRHWHLPYFGVFAIVSMYVAGGLMILLTLGYAHSSRALDPAVTQLVALGGLLVMWLFGFSWLSRKFERQADLYGVRCITPDVKACVDRCPVHGAEQRPGICVAAVNLFGRTLGRIADLNGIPRDAPSWRHGSIQSRCRLLESFAGDAAALQRFDRHIVRIKASLIAMTIVGTVVAIILYYKPVMKGMGWM